MSEWKIRFGTAGTSDSFTAMGYKNSLDIPAYTEKMGLDAFEYQCGHGVRLGLDKARQMADNAAARGILFSVHAPYYISASSLDEEKRLNSVNYLLQSAALCRALGGRRVIFHSGSCGRQSREAALEKALDTLKRAQDALDEAGFAEITLCPETMGKIGQLGTLEEVLALCGVDRRITPCIDFGHLNARTLGGCRTGEAKLTGAYRLPCKYVIHTVGPVWNGGKYGEREQLASCYRSSLALAKKHGCETVAFPLISSGVFGYPKDQSLRVAVDTISEFLAENDMTVYLVIFSRAAYAIGNKLFADIAAYIDDHYVDAHTDSRRERMRRMSVVESRMLTAYEDAPMATSGLDEALAHLDAGFSETLLKLIDRSGKKDAEVYKKANVDRKLFSKIRNNPDYKPSKPTAVAFAIALELSLPETRDLIARAGYALSPSSKFDVIIEYFIMRRDYDIFKINEALFAFDQSLLGA